MQKNDPADVAKVEFGAMMRADGDLVAGWKLEIESTIASVFEALTRR